MYLHQEPIPAVTSPGRTSYLFPIATPLLLLFADGKFKRSLPARNRTDTTKKKRVYTHHPRLPAYHQPWHRISFAKCRRFQLLFTTWYDKIYPSVFSPYKRFNSTTKKGSCTHSVFVLFITLLPALLPPRPRPLNTCKKRNERPNVGDVSVSSSKSAPSRKGSVVNGQMTKAGNQ